MRVIGLDLSLTSTGVALPDGSVRRITVKAVGVERLVRIADAVRRLAVADLAVIEGYAFGRQNQAAHLGELGGVIRVSLFGLGVPYVEVPPALLKKFATGKGNASKEDMLVAAVKRLGYDGASNDEADALWLRAAALDAYGLPVAEMPRDQRAVLGKVDWPEMPDRLVGVA